MSVSLKFSTFVALPQKTEKMKKTFKPVSTLLGVAPRLSENSWIVSLLKGRDFFPLAQAEIKNRNETNKKNAKKQKKVSQSTRKNEQTALNLFGNWLGWDIKTNQITAGLISDFEAFLKSLTRKDGKTRRLKDSTVAEYMRSLRAVCNRMGLNGEALFATVDTKNGSSRKRALSQEDMEKLAVYMATLKPDSSDNKMLMLFFFLILADGMPFVDMAFLKWKQVGDGFIVYNRQKTGVEVTVPINEDMKVILRMFREAGDRDDEYVFRLLKSYDPDEAMKEYQILLNGFNRALHRIGKMAGLSVPLTSYVARHTWATTACHLGMSLAEISKALGHTSLMTTMKYIKEISTKQLVTCNKRVAESLNLRLGIWIPA